MLNTFRKLGIRNKLLLSYAAIVLIGTAALVMSIRGTSELGAAVEHSAHVVTTESEIAQELREFQEASLVTDLAGKDYLLTGDPAYLDAREEAQAEAEEHLAEALELVSGHQEEDILGLMEELESSKTQRESYVDILALYEAGDREAAIALLQNRSESMDEEVESLIHHSAEELEEAIEEVHEVAESKVRSVLLTSIAGMAASIVIAAVASIFLAGSITNPIKKLRDLADKVSMGDLDVNNTVTAKDEIGDLSESFDRMVVAVKFLSSTE